MMFVARRATSSPSWRGPSLQKGINYLKMSSTSHAQKSSPIVELREYQLHPSQTSKYTQHTIQSAPLRKKLPLAFFGLPETGSIPLNTAVHLYKYPGGHTERQSKRSELAKMDEWKQYLEEVKACMMQQSSTIYQEASIVHDFEELKGLQYWVNNDTSASKSKGIVELRKYQLKLGYDTVPKFLQLYSEALPSKLNADGTHPTTELVTLLFSDVGSLNTVIEVWKHGGADSCGLQAMEKSRQASRTAKDWRNGMP